ncbi:PREDICTED: LOW QUALITY PROTEIN: polycystic kidney disease protein 1-like 2 [Branchiostoma belcheri]|uniref:LOW QUALITY PROTEIN: polycystic kidney disease protein 1-like 2 n=1 Tax=Branchiostoma belcheri TaxID=7741 RepID=A0A6P4XX26_BRABE|nr:PREDICTED: LOW QUALITY PROTEIN: polycystic kidney disease protein 1-like 2 [Branchiostoma belcheri]
MEKLLMLIAALLVSVLMVFGTELNPCRPPPDVKVCGCSEGVSRTNPGETCTVCACGPDNNTRDCFVYRHVWLDIAPWWAVEESGGTFCNDDECLETVDKAKNAFDGELGTFWEPLYEPTGYRHWVILDLQKVWRIYRIGIANYGDIVHDVMSFLLESSPSNAYNWGFVDSSDGVQAGLTSLQTFDVYTQAQFLRITVDTHSGEGPRIREISLYGTDQPPLAEPCAVVHTGCILNEAAEKKAPPADQQCYVIADIHEGIRDIENALSVHRTGNITFHGELSIECVEDHEISLYWTLRGEGPVTSGPPLDDILPEDMPDNNLHFSVPPRTLPLGLYMVQDAGYYTIRLTDTFGIWKKISEWRFQVLPTPFPGSGSEQTAGGDLQDLSELCTLLPAAGTALIDRFCVTCQEFVDLLGPLETQVTFELEPLAEIATVTFPGHQEPTLNEVVLKTFTGWVRYTDIFDLPSGIVSLHVRFGSPDGRFIEFDMEPALFLESNFNPFEYSNNSRIIRADVTGLHVKCGNVTIPVSGLSQPNDILTSRKNGSLENSMYVFKASEPLGSLTYFKFFVKKNQSALSFSFDYNSAFMLQNITLFLRKETPPTPEDYNWTTTLPVPDEKAGMMSNASHIHCRCDHLTKFSGFVTPNPLNIAAALSANVLENPAGLILVLTVLGMYFMGLVWTRKQDRRDLAKVGVGILPGHRLNPRKDCQYVITVYTGFKGNAGTTAEVTIVLYSQDRESPPFTLSDSRRITFEKGSVDSFLVSTSEPLGDLIYLRVWHNNAGYSPAWFLSQIVVTNRANNKPHIFLCNRWFATDEDDGKVYRLLPESGPDEMKEFRLLFLAKSSRDMNDGHLWFSVAGRPARSPFTRVQRLSCCLTLLYSTMITNIMFFGRGDDFDPPEPLRFAGVEINPPLSLPQIMIGLQSAAIILPVNLLIVFLFRNSDSRPAKKQKENSGNNVPLHNLAKYLPHKKSANKTRTVVSYDSGVDTPSFWHREENDAKLQNHSPSRTYTGPIRLFFENIKKKITTDKETDDFRKTGTPAIPWWAVYFAWLIVWSASFVAAFFTVLYSLSFGRAKAEAWLFTFLTSFLTDLFLVQPFKLLLVAMLFALLVKEPIEDDDPEPAPLHIDEDYLLDNTRMVENRQWSTATGWMRYMWAEKDETRQFTSQKTPGMVHSDSPPDESALAVQRAQNTQKRRRRKQIVEVLMFGLFLTVIMLTSYGERSPLAFYVTKDVQGLILESGDISFSEIEDIPSFWTWVKTGLIPATHVSRWYNGWSVTETMVLDDMLTHPLGPVQLRQVRLKPGIHCEPPERMVTVTSRCVPVYSLGLADTQNYTERWNTTANTTGESLCISTATESLELNDCLSADDGGQDPWRYKFAPVIDAFPYFGKHGTYSAGGYVTSLGRTEQTSLARAAYLQRLDWLDDKTRAVFIELTLYNPHVNLFSVVSMAVEFTNLGATYKGSEVVTLRLIQRDAILLLALRGVFVLLVLVYAFKEGKALLSRPFDYLSEFWSWVELLVISVGFSALGVYFYTQSIIDEVAVQRAAGNSSFTGYKSAVSWYQVYTYLLGLLICCSTFKFVQILRFNSHVYALSMTLRRSLKPVTQFMFTAGIVIMAFTQTASLILGVKLMEYKNITSSLQSLLLTMLGSFDFETLSYGHSILGPLLFFMYQCMMQFFLLSMFMAIIMDVYADENQPTNQERLEFNDFLRESASKTIRKVKGSSQRTFRERKGVQRKDRRDMVTQIDQVVAKFGTYDTFQLLVSKVQLDACICSVPVWSNQIFFLI